MITTGRGFGAPESPIDRAIDRAVRDIMRVDPPAGLRRRVMARIEAPPRRSILFPRFTVAAAALAVLVLTVVLMRPTAPAPAPIQQAAAPAAPAAAPRPVTPAPAKVTAASRPATGPKIEKIRMPPVANVFGSGSGVSSTSLRDAPDAARVETVDQGPAEPAGVLAPIAVRPLNVPPIAVEPLRIPTIAPPK